MAPDTHELEETEGGFSAGATAEMLRLSPRTLRRAIGRGELLAIDRSGVLYINPDDLIEYRARHQSPIRVPGPGPTVPLVTTQPTPRATDFSGILPTPLTPLIARSRELKALVTVVQPSRVTPVKRE